MSLCCVICGRWYQVEGRDTLDICPPCFSMNFAAAQPPLDPWGTARQALEASVDASTQRVPTPRLADAIRRVQARWEADAQRRLDGEEP